MSYSDMRMILSGGFCGICGNGPDKARRIDGRKGCSAEQVKRLGARAYFAVTLFYICLARHPLRIHHVGIRTLRKLYNGERAAHACMQTTAESEHLQRAIGPLARLVQVITLVSHHP